MGSISPPAHTCCVVCVMLQKVLALLEITGESVILGTSNGCSDCSQPFVTWRVRRWDLAVTVEGGQIRALGCLPLLDSKAFLSQMLGKYRTRWGLYSLLSGGYQRRHTIYQELSLRISWFDGSFLFWHHSLLVFQDFYQLPWGYCRPQAPYWSLACA